MLPSLFLIIVVDIDFDLRRQVLIGDFAAEGILVGDNFDNLIGGHVLDIHRLLVLVVLAHSIRQRRLPVQQHGLNLVCAERDVGISCSDLPFF